MRHTIQSDGPTAAMQLKAPAEIAQADTEPPQQVQITAADDHEEEDADEERLLDASDVEPLAEPGASARSGP